MNLIGRFTRDAASKYIWGVLTLLAILGLAFAVWAGGRAVEDERRAAESRAVGYVGRLFEARLGALDLTEEITVPIAQALRVAVSDATDARVVRVRVWKSDGTLLFSTDRTDDVGSNEGVNDPLLARAARDGTFTLSDVSDTGGADDPERSLLRTYVPLVDPGAVAEIDQAHEGTIGPVRTTWLRYQILAGVVLLLLLVLTGLSLREPVERINAGVPFAGSSIPAGYSVIDNDRLFAVREVYRLASEREARLEEKLAESEQVRWRLEGEMQQLLSKASTSAPRATPPTRAARRSASRAAEGQVVEVPESEIVTTPPEGFGVAAAGALARAERETKPAPTSRRRKQAQTAKSRRPKAKTAEAGQKASGTTRTKKPKPTSAPEPTGQQPPEESTPHPAVPDLDEAGATGAQASATEPSVVEVGEAKDHEEALETFIRLTESDRQPADTEPRDQGAVRAALARTAARKKPGGEKLRPHDEPPQERLGGPPPG